MSLEQWGLIYIGIISIIGFYVMGLDKKKARKNEYRISEKTLWILSFLGGAMGTYWGMKHFRHKTKHTSFREGLPLLAIIYLVIVIILWTR
ncbi:DUF1294 domain-containing protein [Jeotgalibacillus soli]|uniref:DUF1294 domain-containing protein n=1 Tax=Jeotgalibacillus soli TaxID=889306 RepID=A0A0C2VH06_9BACL|nr:DUF1294 domain-containing protein [Jeotgalibacillus soli]KIL43796.1 hypothetical protein KP78_36200 [Jeotgalibacillus soli]